MVKKELVKKEETQNLPTVQQGSPLDNAKAIAAELSKSDIIPKEFQNKPANCLIAVELANRLKASPFQVMQNMDVIYGRPSLRSSFVIGCINNSGKILGSLKFDGDAEKCRAWAIEKETGEKLLGPFVTMEMAANEGWLNKNGSKWKTMPGLMMRYRAAAFFGRLYCPEILNGMLTDDEATDVGNNTTEKIIDVFAEPEEAAKQIEEKPTVAVKDEEQDIPQDLIDRANAYEDELNAANEL